MPNRRVSPSSSFAPPKKLALNTRHPLAKHLCFLVYPGLSTYDFVGKSQGVLLTSGSWVGNTRLGPGLTSTSTSDGGAYWAYSPALNSITTSFTIAALADVTGLANWSTLLCVPYYNGSWLPPYGALALQKHDSSSSLDLNFASGGSANSVQSVAGMIQTTDGPKLYGGTRDGTTAKFWRDAILYDTQTYGSNGAVDLVNKQGPAALNHSGSSPGEAITGKMEMAAIFNIALNDRWWAELNADPYMLVRPDRQIWGFFAGGTTYTQGLSGGGAGSGVIIRQTNKVAAGAGAGVGALIKQARKTLVGSGAGSGSLTTARFYTLLLTGAGAASGAISKQINKTLAGAGAASGTISKSVQRLLTGAGAGVGAISKQMNKVLDGAGAGVGSLIKQANKIVAGAGEASGTISKLVNKVLSGGGEGSGVLDAVLGAVTYYVNLVGGGAGSGSLTKTTQRLLTGGGAGVGSLIKQINRVLTGAGAGSGALNATRLYTVILSGAGAASGAISKQINKVLSGSGAGSGTISKLIQRILSGAGQAVGALVGLLGGEIPRGSVSSRNALVSRASATDGLFFSAVGRDAARYSVTSSDSEEN